MGYEYIHINSADRKNHETSSRMTIQLSKPIYNAHTVKVMSFTCANEFFNVSEGNNQLSIIVYPFEMGIVVEVPEFVTIQIPPGLYTIAELCEILNANISTITLMQLPNTEFKFSQIENKVQLEITQLPDPLQEGRVESIRAVIYYQKHDPNFYTSILHRLGFSRTQVCDDAMIHFRSNAQVNIEAYTPTGEWVPEAKAPYLVWDGIDIVAHESGYFGFESHPYVYLKSDELVKHCTRSIKNSDGSTCTAHTNILQSIPIAVNLFNWIHYFGNDAVLSHTLDGRTIQDFDIGLTNNNHNYFPSSHFKDFAVELMFETLDDADQNKKAIRALANKGYELRHNCS